jgi:hypothetical protein
MPSFALIRRSSAQGGQQQLVHSFGRNGSRRAQARFRRPLDSSRTGDVLIRGESKSPTSTDSSCRLAAPSSAPSGRHTGGGVLPSGYEDRRAVRANF